jgi:hypothetical protein
MKTIKIIVAILTLSVTYHFAAAQGNCPGNKVRISSGTKGRGCTCKSKCVDQSEVATYQATGWWYVGACVHFCAIGFRSEGEMHSVLETFLTEIYPNPASGSVTIEFTLSQQGEVTLEIFDVTGRFVTTIERNLFEEGDNEVNWDASVLNQGIYLLKMTAGDYSAIKRISVIK